MKRAIWTIALAVLMSVAALTARALLPPLTLAEQWLADFRLARLAPPEPIHPDIVVAAITEDTLRLFPYRSPVDRAFMAATVRILEARGARAIGMDMLLDQPTEPSKDQALREALAQARIPIRVSYAGQAEGLNPTQIAYLDNFLPPTLRGQANLAKDPLNETVRWIFPGKDGGVGLVPALAGAISDVATPTGLMPIHWRLTDGGPAFRTIPAHALALVPEGWIRGKIVLVGNDVTLEDRHRTPLSAAGAETMAGVHVHAHALATLLDRRSGRETPEAWVATLTLATAILGASMAWLSWPFMLRLAGAALLLAAGWAAAFLLVRQGGPILPLMTPSLAFALATWGMEAIGHRESQRHRRFIKQAFAQYIAPELVEQLARDPKMLSLSGEKRELTFMFTDLAGFTAVSEGMDPAEITALLNEYLDGICSAVLAQGGTITDFIGDAVFATFGAPMIQPDHRERAIACARAIDAFAEDFRQHHAERGLGGAFTRIGIHTGTATIGNIGSRHRFKYAPVGDAVNTASRLEGLNKHFGTRTCISGPALPEAERAYARAIGPVVLKGRQQALEVFELLPATPAEAERAARWQAMTGADLTAWVSQNPSDGLAAFRLAHADSAEIVMTEK